MNVFFCRFVDPYLHLEWMKQQKLYDVLKTIPKGVLHHDHFECNYDAEFVKNHLFSSEKML